MTIFEQDTSPYVNAQGLDCNPFDADSPFNLSLEGDTKISYIIYKGNVPSV